jgi:hypothetical protein
MITRAAHRAARCAVRGAPWCCPGAARCASRGDPSCRPGRPVVPPGAARCAGRGGPSCRPGGPAARRVGQRPAVPVGGAESPRRGAERRPRRARRVVRSPRMWWGPRMEAFETERLRLRALTEDDLDDLVELDGEAEVRGWVDPLGSIIPADPQERRRYERERFVACQGFYGARERVCDTFVGWFQLEPSRARPNESSSAIACAAARGESGTRPRAPGRWSLTRSTRRATGASTRTPSSGTPDRSASWRRSAGVRRPVELSRAAGRRILPRARRVRRRQGDQNEGERARGARERRGTSGVEQCCARGVAAPGRRARPGAPSGRRWGWAAAACGSAGASSGWRGGCAAAAWGPAGVLRSGGRGLSSSVANASATSAAWRRAWRQRAGESGGTRRENMCS